MPGTPRGVIASLVLATACGVSTSRAAPEAGVTALEPVLAERLTRLALDCVHREYPNKIAHVLTSDADVRPPRELTPAFYGCFDWHSAVHGHWLLARLARSLPDAPLAARARAALAKSLTAENIAGEVAYASVKERQGFERPYGLAWLLQLSAELRTWDDDEARGWAGHLRPLEELAARRILEWLPRLSHPIRTGEHAQTAFAMGLVWDWADTAADSRMRSLLNERARSFYGGDQDCPLHLEPSGHDFLSPCLAEADLMRRVLAPPEFARWLDAALPTLADARGADWLKPALPVDRTDGKLVHLDGLNLSRAWMLGGIARALPEADARVPALRASARAHSDAGLAGVSAEHYAGSHWLGTFATYLLTGAGR